MKRLCLSLILVIFFCGPAWAQLTHFYQTKFQDTEELVDRSYIKMTGLDNGDVSVHFEKGVPDYKQQEDYIFNGRHGTKSAHIVNKGAGTDYEINRSENTVTVTGMLEGRRMDRTFAIDDDPLFLFPKFNLASFALSEKERITFWSMRNDNLKEYKMIATRDGVENIFLNGTPTYAIKLYVTTENPLFRIFKRTYYFRLNDGLFLKQEYADGRVRELVKEE